MRSPIWISRSLRNLIT